MTTAAVLAGGYALFVHTPAARLAGACGGALLDTWLRLFSVHTQDCLPDG
ncbi:hypothetical protein [Streptomyces sp. NBC_00078]|nr:hypothetical protein [Streptomyces sp. NBC_00078]MCX5422858.1 hypothetical protein [Streptomyces sp. NBC_00078]